MTRDDLDAPARRLWLLVREQVGADAGGRAGSAAPAGGAGRAAHQVAGVLLLVGRPVGSPARRAVRRSLSSRRARRASRTRDWIVGDLGCGTGQVSAALAPFVARVIAVDASAAMLQAREEAAARLRQRRSAPRRARGAADRRRPARRGDADAGAAPRARAGARARRSGARAQAGRPRCSSSTCCRTIARATASRWATSGSGFREEHVRRLLADAGFDGRPDRAAAARRAEPRVRGCSSQRRRNAATRKTTTARRMFSARREIQHGHCQSRKLHPFAAAQGRRPRAVQGQGPRRSPSSAARKSASPSRRCRA